MQLAEITRVGVVGAGTMGAGIAEVFYDYTPEQVQQLIASRDARLLQLLRLKRQGADAGPPG